MCLGIVVGLKCLGIVIAYVCFGRPHTGIPQAHKRGTCDPCCINRIQLSFPGEVKHDETKGRGIQLAIDCSVITLHLPRLVTSALTCAV